MIRICIVDDQTLLRDGLRSLLACLPEMEVVGDAADGESAIEVIERTKPDVVLLDIRMPKVDGVGVLRELSRRRILPPASTPQAARLPVPKSSDNSQTLSCPRLAGTRLPGDSCRS